MRKIWIMVSAVLLSCVFGSGYFYFFSSVVKKPNIGEQQKDVSSVVDSSMVYFNQIGVYKNPDKMEKEVEELEKKGITIYSFKRNDLTVFVSHVSLEKSKTLEGQTELASLGYSFLLKECEVENQEIASVIASNDYQKALEMIYEN